MKNGIIYNGPSLLDGKPIVAIATYSDRNTKTGKVLQTYIIRSDISPLDASKTGADFSICGDCKFRGTPTTDPLRKQAVKRECYVNLGQGPTIVYKSYKRGVYPAADNVADRVDLGAGRVVRLGTYGDPAAVPSWIWDQLIRRCESHLAYSQQGSRAAGPMQCLQIMRRDLGQVFQVNRNRATLGRVRHVLLHLFN